MKYCSTRGGQAGLSFQDVLFAGYAKDGGLYMPESVPRVSAEELTAWADGSYADVMHNIVSKFVSREEIPSDALKDIISSSLRQFRHPEVVAVRKLDGGLNVVELFHGATLAFKDLALSVVGGLLDYFLTTSGRHITVLIGTSGDTGSAAIEAVRGRNSVDIVVLLPDGRCTQIQQLQMTTVLDDNVHVYCVDGSSDDLDQPIKQAFADPDLVTRHDLISINSINWGRIMAQVTHYFYAYYRLCGRVGEPVQFVVPTGACGNITAGCLAKQMGLPITLVAAVNSNDIVARTLTNGDFSVRASLVQTFASAMDIQVPYNVERILFLNCGQDYARVKAVMKEYEDNGKVDIPRDILDAMKDSIVDSVVVDDKEIVRVMGEVYRQHNYTLCPHSATAAAYHFQNKCPGVARGYFAPASPAKFPEAVREAGATEVTEGVAHLKDLPTRSERMNKGEDWFAILKTRIEDITKKRTRK